MELIASFSPPLLFKDGFLRQGNLSMLPSAFSILPGKRCLNLSQFWKDTHVHEKKYSSSKY